MSPALELTSVPAWATAPTLPDADATGRWWTVIAFGPAGAEVARRWESQLGDCGHRSAVRTHDLAADDHDGARAALAADLTDARVGWRLMMAGPADSCLRLRAAAMESGVADDEMVVASTEVRGRAVQCVHCRTVTTADVELSDVLPCRGCGRNLLVYYHVSRRQGAHLGYMVDAEEQGAR
ncbi:MAG: dimethylamine monooxygenase subunit DmmA family protein [Actinomycetota bacterium]|nr:dimethylamine monooxygenase subunit DmmA family protein [Actinomycetota bacterium]